jgi:hypothetical protein
MQRRRVIFGDRVDQIGKGLFQPLKATVNEGIHPVIRAGQVVKRNYWM